MYSSMILVLLVYCPSNGLLKTAFLNLSETIKDQSEVRVLGQICHSLFFWSD